MNGTVVQIEKARALRDQAVTRHLNAAERRARWHRRARAALILVGSLVLGAAVGIAWQAWVRP